MQPQFRSDLKASREEQQGVVFYRIDDPSTQTSFRLYEIEFLIAKKLDGARSLPQVIGAVKAEYNFDISEPDLRKFVSQLESMGFIHTAGDGRADFDTTVVQPMGLDADEVTAPGPPGGSGGGAFAEELFAEAVGDDGDAPLDDASFALVDVGTIDDDTASSPSGVPGAEDVQVISAAEFDPRRPTASPDEIQGMLRTAFEHLRGGYLVHARDYFLAARESRPTDENLATIVAHLQTVPDEPGPSELDRLWQLCATYYPRLAEEAGGPPVSFDGDLEPEGGGHRRSRVLWISALVTLCVAGVVGLLYVLYAARVFEGTAQVEVMTLTSEDIPVFYAEPAVKVGPLQEKWLTLEEGGKITEVAEVGKRVEAGELILALNVKPAVKKKLENAHAQLAKMQQQYEKAAEKLAELLQKREQITLERDDAEAKLKELRPKSVLKSGGVSKQDLETYKKVVVQANKKLSKLAKKERKPREQERKAKEKVDEASAKIVEIETRIGAKLIKAPWVGVVVERKVEVGDEVEPGTEAVLLRDPLGARITFNVPAAGDVQPGGEAYVTVAGGAPAAGKVLAVDPIDGGVKLEVNLADPAAAFWEMEPAKFQLVREFAKAAYAVDSRALVEGAETEDPSIFVALQGRAVRRGVEILSRNQDRSVIRAQGGNLRNGDQAIVARVDEGTVGTLLDDTEVEVKVKDDEPVR